MSGQHTTGHQRRGDIQGLRAVAVLLVVVYHSRAALTGGFVGVDVFFVISGFVITRMLVAELDRTAQIDLKRFYLRRIRRILPALAFLLVVVLVAGILFAPFGGQQLAARTGGAAALFGANFYLLRFGGEGGYFDVDAETNALLHTWSLSVEEQFYFVFPALLFGAWIIAKRRGAVTARRPVFVVLVGVCVISFALSLVFTYGYLGPVGSIDAIADLHREFAFYMPFTRAWEFGAGALLAVAKVGSNSLARLSTLLAFTGVALIAWASVVFDDLTAFPGIAAIIPVVGVGLLVVAGETPGSNPVSMLLSTRPLQWLGDLSYSWYLWHWPLIVFADAIWPTTTGVRLMAVVVSLVPAWVSFRLVENPVRFRPNPSVAATLRLGAVCITVPLLAAALLQGGHRAIDQSDEVSSFEDATQFHADFVRGCASGDSIANPSPECRWTVENSSGQAVLIGDSNAGHFTEGFVAATNNVGWDATVVSFSNCPFVDLVAIENGLRNEACSQFVAQAVADLRSMTDVHIVIASASDGYIEESEFVLEDPTTGQRFVTPAEKAAAWSDGLQRLIAQLKVANHPITIVHPIPKFLDWDPRGYAAGWWLFSSEGVGLSETRDYFDHRRARAIAAEIRAVRDFTDVVLVDLTDRLCSTTECSTNRDDVWLWRDGGHISVEASLMLTSTFQELLGATTES